MRNVTRCVPFLFIGTFRFGIRADCLASEDALELLSWLDFSRQFLGRHHFRLGWRDLAWHSWFRLRVNSKDAVRPDFFCVVHCCFQSFAKRCLGYRPAEFLVTSLQSRVERRLWPYILTWKYLNFFVNMVQKGVSDQLVRKRLIRVEIVPDFIELEIGCTGLPRRT